MSSPVPAFLEARRSIRAFRDEPVPRSVLDALVTAACIAPSPHHSRPWRFAVVDTAESKGRLAEGMGARWRADLERDRVAAKRVDALVDDSRRTIVGAPALVLACLTWHGLDRYPDERRQRAEWGMALLSLGAAVENLMLAAAHAGLASCWLAAPIFCPDEARVALALPDDWQPQALVLLGRAAPDFVGRARLPVPIEDLRANR
jgi:F420 biosynthesis protein FbiB-like protein